MKTTKLLESELDALKIASLPTRPTVPEANGGAGFTATDMKRAFDRLPLFIAERLNSLIDDILAEGEASILGSIKTGISENHTLYDMLCDIKSGGFANYLSAGAGSLSDVLLDIREDIDAILHAMKDSGIQCSELYLKYGV